MNRVHNICKKVGCYLIHQKEVKILSVYAVKVAIL